MPLRLLLPLLLLCCGCVSMNRFGTARTLPAGEANTSVTFDAMLATAPGMEQADVTSFVAPHLRHNRGLAPGTELVLDLGLPGTLGADVKVELYRGGAIDLAVAPGASMSWLGRTASSFGGEVHLPVLADVVVAPWLVLVPQASVGWLAAKEEASSELRHSPAAGGGLGLYLRVADTFSVQPVASTTVELDTLYAHHRFGLAFSFGTQPSFR